jgi:hypothetical protein
VNRLILQTDPALGVPCGVYKRKTLIYTFSCAALIPN